MPGVDGLELCRLAREAFGERVIYIIVLTARRGAESMLQGFAAGADDYLTKPFRPDELRARVDVGFRVVGLQRMLGDRVVEHEADGAPLPRARRQPRRRSSGKPSSTRGAHRFMSRQAAQLLGGRRPSASSTATSGSSHVLPADRAGGRGLSPRSSRRARRSPACDYHLMADDGRVLTVRDQARPVFDERGPRRVRGVTIDVTERRRAREQFEAAMKMQADFVNFASHQLRTPLTGIKWMLELALGEADGSADMRGFVADSLDASERLIVLVNDLLERVPPRGRPHDGHRRRAATSAQLDEGRASPTSSRSCASCDHQLTVDGPRRRARGAWATPSCCARCCRTWSRTRSSTRRTAAASTSRSRNDGAEVRCAVTDTGIGVPEAARPRLFEKFFRAENVTKVETEGTGLGLYIVRLIVERAHGRIWYRAGRDGRQPLPDRPAARDDRPEAAPADTRSVQA